jgi:hypothetical protein
MAYDEVQAQSHALDLVKSALQSAAVRLQGPPTFAPDAEKYGEADAKYLAKLIKDLTAALQK